MHKLKLMLVWVILLPLCAAAQQDSVLSGAYHWKTPAWKKKQISSQVLLEGKVHDFEWMQISSNLMSYQRKFKQIVPDTSELVMIVQSGWAMITINDSVYVLTPRSVVVLMPGQEFTLQTRLDNLEFFSMKYKSKKPVDIQRGNRSFVKKWEDIPFKGNNNGGGRRDFFEQPTPMQKRFEMHVTTLKEGLKSHEPHTHRAEEIVWILEGKTEMQLGDTIVKTGPFGFYYLGSNVSHAIKNTGTTPATYFAFQFE